MCDGARRHGLPQGFGAGLLVVTFAVSERKQQPERHADGLRWNPGPDDVHPKFDRRRLADALIVRPQRHAFVPEFVRRDERQRAIHPDDEPAGPILRAAGTPIVYGELVLGASVQFSNYFGFTNVTIPTSIASLSSTNTVYETLYDGNSGAQLGSTVSLTPNGQSFTFTGFVGSGPFSATAFDTYYLVISYQ